MFGRDKVARLVAEFLGTGILTLVVLSVQRSTIGVPYFVALAAGLAVALLFFVFSSVSGAHFNPALTIGLWTARKVQTLQAVLYIVVQLLGAWLAYYLYTYFVANPLQPIGGHFSGRVLVAEAVGTAIFSFAFAAVVYQRFTEGVRASVAGVAFALSMIVAAAASIGLINPALALGTRAWNFAGSMGWNTYVLGPVLGAIIGVNLYALLFAPAGQSVFASVKVGKPATVAATASKPAVSARKATSKKKTAKKK